MNHQGDRHEIEQLTTQFAAPATEAQTMTTTMRETELRKRMNDLEREERARGDIQPELLYFTDNTKPAGKRFLGACVVMAFGFISAVTKAHALGNNPGGAVLWLDSPKGLDKRLFDRLITDDAEMEQLGFKRRAA